MDEVQRQDALLAETMAKGSRRIGVFMELPMLPGAKAYASEGGVWRRAGRQWLWGVRLTAVEAIGLRVALWTDAAPEGTKVWAYAPNQDIVTPPAGLHPDEQWLPTVWAEEVLVLCALPPGASPKGLSLRISEVAYLYHSPLAAKQGGACNLDVTCYENWADTASAVAGIGTVGINGILWCTGSLLADERPGRVPYFLTADHCVSTDASADAVEVYWFYQTASCGGTPPSPTAVPRSASGADLLVTSYFETGTDVSLLRLRDVPPLDAAYLGITSEPQPLGAEVTCIHHPSGGHKRITFGVITDDGVSSFGGARLQPVERYHETTWTEGTTEGGSSGSPLLNTATQQVIGQLFGGFASCSLPDQPDYYGRMDVSAPLLTPWLSEDGNGPALYTLSVSVDGPGALMVDASQTVPSGAAAELTFPEGAYVLLQPQPETSGVWTDFEGDTVDRFGYVFVYMNSNKSVRASFSSSTNPEGEGEDSMQPAPEGEPVAGEGEGESTPIDLDGFKEEQGLSCGSGTGGSPWADAWLLAAVVLLLAAVQRRKHTKDSSGFKA